MSAEPQAAGVEAPPGPMRPAGTGAVRAATGAVTTTIVCVMPVFLVGGLAVQVGRDLGFDPARLGLLVALYNAGSALSSLPSGALAERYGPTVTSRAGILLAAGCLIAIGTAARSYLTLVLLLVAGAGANALGQLASNLSLARHVPPGRMGLSFGVKQSGIPITTLLAGASVPAIALTIGWRWAFVIAGVLALPVLLLVPAEPPGPARRPAPRDGERATTALIVICAAVTLAAAGANALGTFLVHSAVHQGIGEAAAGLTLTFGSAVGIACRLLGGWLADRRTGGHVAVVGFMLAAGATGLALLAAPGLPALIAGTALAFGLGWSWPGVLNYAIVRLHPSAPAAATSINQLGVYLGSAAGPLGLGAVAKATSYPTMWLLAAVSMVCAAALMLVGRRLLLAHVRART